MKHTLTLIFTCCLIFMFTFFTGCNKNSDDEEPVGNDVAQERVSDSCEGCHTNYDVLKTVYTPDPPSTGGGGCGGLYNGHKFNKTPDMRDHCTTCHVSRGGHAYYGIAPGTVPDIHLTGAGFTCMDCHTTNEIHGDGEEYNQRYKMPLLPKCENCHTNLADANEYHTAHLNTFNCQTCHSQDYNNCGSCHIGSHEGARIASHQDFHIGMNPIPETKPYKYALLRQSLSAPDSWQDYGIANLENFAVAPTYKYTTPHNIQRWTARTEVEEGKPCYDACHIIKEEDVYRNIELYLFRSDLEDWEVEADVNIVVDGHLPAAWDVH